MNSLRPLVTIAIIVVVGVFLFTKFNEEPPKLSPAMSEALQNAPVDMPPPLAGNSPTTLTPAPPLGVEETPQWAPPITDTPTSAVPQSASTGNEKFGAPAVPAIPELPPLPTMAQASENTPQPPVNSQTVGTPPPFTIPVDPPAARYPAENAVTLFGASGPYPAATVPPMPTNTIGATSSSNGTSADSVFAPATSAAPAAPTGPTFATSWAEVQVALARQELAQAHQLLSRWYADSTLTRAESQQVTALLAQLAGTVVYSTEHRLEPPYVVRPGDTLETIAAQYEVPWQLLAKINGIPATDAIRPGQELKVVHGPFSAVVNLTKNELTLMLNDRYAGAFAIMKEPTAVANEGDWIVEEKLLNPPQATPLGSAYASVAANDRVLVLRNKSGAVGGATISISSGNVTPAGLATAPTAALRLSASDAEEVADILSVGSRVTIRK